MLTRRNLIRSALCAAVAAPLVIPASAIGAGDRPAPSNRIGLGHIGVGGRGGGLLGGFLGNAESQSLAVSDTDATRSLTAAKRITERYTQVAPGTYAGCKEYKDFRELLARPDIDGVVVATPDHWHALVTIMAAKAGKDIYCEKPMASTIGDGRASANAVKRYGRVFRRAATSGPTPTHGTPPNWYRTDASGRSTPSARTCPPATAAPEPPAQCPCLRASTTTRGWGRRRGSLTIPGGATATSAGSWITPTAN